MNMQPTWWTLCGKVLRSCWRTGSVWRNCCWRRQYRERRVRHTHTHTIHFVFRSSFTCENQLLGADVMKWNLFFLFKLWSSLCLTVSPHLFCLSLQCCQTVRRARWLNWQCAPSGRQQKRIHLLAEALVKGYVQKWSRYFFPTLGLWNDYNSQND